MPIGKLKLIGIELLLKWVLFLDLLSANMKGTREEVAQKPIRF